MTTTLRATVMLSVLVGLPAAWIYYGPLPPEAQSAVSGALAKVKGAIGWAKTEPAADAWVHVPATSSESKTLPIAIKPQSAAAERLVEAPPLVASEPVQPQQLTLAQRVEPSLAKLRQLGAVEYALEHWGAGGKLYRFRCEMTIGTSQLTQQFEAVAADPQMSIEQVLAEVTARQVTAQPTEVRPAGFAM